MLAGLGGVSLAKRGRRNHVDGSSSDADSEILETAAKGAIEGRSRKEPGHWQGFRPRGDPVILPALPTKAKQPKQQLVLPQLPVHDSQEERSCVIPSLPVEASTAPVCRPDLPVARDVRPQAVLVPKLPTDSATETRAPGARTASASLPPEEFVVDRPVERQTRSYEVYPAWEPQGVLYGAAQQHYASHLYATTAAYYAYQQQQQYQLYQQHRYQQYQQYRQYQQYQQQQYREEQKARAQLAAMLLQAQQARLTQEERRNGGLQPANIQELPEASSTELAAQASTSSNLLTWQNENAPAYPKKPDEMFPDLEIPEGPLFELEEATSSKAGSLFESVSDQHWDTFLDNLPPMAAEEEDEEDAEGDLQAAEAPRQLTIEALSQEEDAPSDEFLKSVIGVPAVQQKSQQQSGQPSSHLLAADLPEVGDLFDNHVVVMEEDSMEKPTAPAPTILIPAPGARPLKIEPPAAARSADILEELLGSLLGPPS